MDSIEKNSYKVKNLSWLLRIIVCFVLLFFLFKQIHFTEVLENFRKINFFLLFFVVVFTLIGQMLLVLRWKSILARLKAGLPFWQLFRYYFIALFFNTFLPATVGGDLIKGYLTYRHNKKLQISFFSVFTDRYIGVFSLIFLAFLGSFFIDLDYKGCALSMWIFILVLMYIIISLAFISSPVKKWVNSRRMKTRFLYTIANSILKTVKFIIKNKTTFFLCLFYSLASYLTVVLIHYFLALGMGRPVSLGLLFIYVSLIALGTMIPVSINGVGLREFLYVYLFSFCGWDSNLAVSVCWMTFGSYLVVSALGGILYLFGSDLKKV